MTRMTVGPDGQVTLPPIVQEQCGLQPGAGDLADRCFALLQQNPSHLSLRFKKARRYWSERVGLHYWVLARERLAQIEDDGTQRLKGKP